MDIHRAMEKAEDDLVRQLNEGQISEDEFHDEMRDLAEDHRAMAEEAAQEAYDREMGW